MKVKIRFDDLPSIMNRTNNVDWYPRDSLSDLLNAIRVFKNELLHSAILTCFLPRYLDQLIIFPNITGHCRTSTVFLNKNSLLE